MPQGKLCPQGRNMPQCIALVNRDFGAPSPGLSGMNGTSLELSLALASPLDKYTG